MPRQSDIWLLPYPWAHKAIIFPDFSHFQNADASLRRLDYFSTVMKTLLRIASYVMVLAIGLAGGFYFGFGAGKGSALALDMVEADYYSTYAAMQFAEGTDFTREETLRVFIALAEKRKGRWTP